MGSHTRTSETSRSDLTTTPETSKFNTTIRRLCSNGHPLDPEDEMCFKCGATVAAEPTIINQEPAPQDKETVIDGWTVIDRLESH